MYVQVHAESIEEKKQDELINKFTLRPSTILNLLNEIYNHAIRMDYRLEE